MNERNVVVAFTEKEATDLAEAAEVGNSNAYVDHGAVTASAQRLRDAAEEVAEGGSKD